MKKLLILLFVLTACSTTKKEDDTMQETTNGDVGSINATSPLDISILQINGRNKVFNISQDSSQDVEIDLLPNGDSWSDRSVAIYFALKDSSAVISYNPANNCINADGKTGDFIKVETLFNLNLNQFNCTFTVSKDSQSKSYNFKPVYLIKSKSDFNNTGLALKKNFALLNDIALDAATAAIVPDFYGIFDGRGKKITNLIIDASSSNNIALFANLHNGAAIKNLILVIESVVGNTNVAGLVANWNGDDATKQITNVNVNVNGEIKASSNLGAIVGSSSSGLLTISNSSVTGNGKISSLNGSLNSAGSIIGSGKVNITNSFSELAIQADGASIVGGLAGDIQGIVSYSYYKSNINKPIDTIGGIAGQFSGSINNSFSKSSITCGTVQNVNSQNAGGLVGSFRGANSVISNSYFQGDISCNQNVAGLVAIIFSDTTLVSVYYKGTLTGSNNLGSLFGVSSGKLSLINTWVLKGSPWGNPSSLGDVNWGSSTGPNEYTSSGFKFNNNDNWDNQSDFPVLKSSDKWQFKNPFN